jgi:hypothetical protein
MNHYFLQITCPCGHGFQPQGEIPLEKAKRPAWIPKATPLPAFLCPECNAVYCDSECTFEIPSVEKRGQNLGSEVRAALVTTERFQRNCKLPSTTIVLVLEGLADSDALEVLRRADIQARCDCGCPPGWSGERSTARIASSLIAELFQIDRPPMNYFVGSL